MLTTIAVVSLLLVTANAVVWTGVWLALRIREEIHVRRNHICWIDDTVCPECGGYASYAEYRDSQRV